MHLRPSNRDLIRSRAVAAVALLAILAARPELRAAALEGHVINGTTNKPVGAAKVSLIQLQQSMTPVAEATADSQGVFHFDGVEKYSGSPVLLQVEYEGATYSQPLLGPQAIANGVQFKVYDASRDKSIVAVKEHAIFLRPSAGQLEVIEQVSIDNNSNPPRTYVNPEGTYTYALPGTPKGDVQASIQGAAGMPIPQTPEALKPTGSFAITYPIRPGESQIRLQYSLDYKAPYDFSKKLLQPAEQTHIVTPGEGVELTGEQLTALGKEPSSGMLAYQVTPAGGIMKLKVSGEAPAEQAQTQTDSQIGEGESGGLVEIADAATDRRWLILSALGLLLIGGFVFLYNK
jgi:hypothetical protein